jgi:predicted glycosyltransferase
VIRPHPREDATTFESAFHRSVRVIVSTDGESRDLVMAADVVTGMNTMLLVEACLLGCLTVSLQPGLRLPDALPTNRSGKSIAVYREQDIEPVLERLLAGMDARPRHEQVSMRFDCGATQRVAKLVYQMMGLGA